MLIPFVLLVTAAVGVVAAIAIAGGDEESTTVNGLSVEDPDPHYPGFRVGATPNRFHGPAPLTVKFAAKPFEGSGDISYVWAFDDGYISREQNPTHRFVKPGYYLVTVDAVDSKKQVFGTSLYLSAWSKRVLKLTKEKKLDPFVAARRQMKLTRQRRVELNRACKRDPDCRRRQRQAEKLELERRIKGHEDCLKKPECRKTQIPADRKACRQARGKPASLERLRQFGVTCQPYRQGTPPALRD